MTSLNTLCRALCLSLLAAPAWTQTTPLLFNLNPSTVNAGSPGFVLTVTGANFVQGSRINWSGSALSTAFVSTAQLTALVPSNLLAGAGSAVVTVSNPDGRSSSPIVFVITAPQLSMVTTALPQATAGLFYSTVLVGTGGTSPYSWTVFETLPAGLTLSANGTLSGTPQASGTFNLTFRITDAQQQSAVRTLALVVAPPPFSITTNSTLPAATTGVQYTHTFLVSGGVPPYRWAATGTLPTGLTLDTAGTLRGTPQGRGNFTFNVQVSDSSTFTANKSFTLTVNPAALSITTESPLFQGTAGTFYTQTFFATGGVTPYTWSIASGQTPPGLSFDGASASLTGTPAQNGSYSFVLRVSDAAGQQTVKTFNIQVDLPRLTIITGAQLPAGQEGVAYSQRLTTTGGNVPYTWTIVNGEVGGLTLDAATGTLSGTPTVSGSFSLTIQVSDSLGSSASRVFTLTINARNLLITSATQLPAGSINQPFQFTFAAEGGAPPYTWSANGLPDGLTLDPNTGELSGAPKAAGSILITVRVTDSARNSATDLFRFTISLPALPEFQISGLSDTAAPASQPALELRLSNPYPIDITGQLTLSFTPETGTGDATIQFSTGGRTVDFKFASNRQSAVYTSSSGSELTTLGIQTGTVAGTITITARLQSGSVDITPSVPPSRSIRIAQAAPVVRSAVLVRTATGFEVRITGYSSPREVTQAVFRFRATSGNPLAQSEITVPVETIFSRWYQDAASARFGSQFLFTHAFTVQGGEASLVTPESVTLVNRSGSTTSPIN